MVSNINKVFYKSSSDMSEVLDESIRLIVTSPPYFNVKNYHLDGSQTYQHSTPHPDDYGAINEYPVYLESLMKTWHECARVLSPNGKLIINAPLMPIKKSELSTHYTRHIFNIYGDIEQSIVSKIEDIYLMDIYVWNRTNPLKKLMFGSYPYPPNFYAQNTVEFIGVFVKDGKPKKQDFITKNSSSLSENEWREYTSQIWNIPVPNKKDVAYGKHTAIMPEEIVRRCVRLFTYVGDSVLDPFAGSGTTLKVAKELGRNFVGYEIYEHYRETITNKLKEADKPKEVKLW